MKNRELIIHATKTIETLKSILISSSLKLSYSSEDFCIGTTKISSAAHPMVCFCQHDADELDKKTITYGKYGIGFSPKWALNNRISPVLYVDGNSLAAKGLATLLKARQNKADKKLPQHLRMPIMEIKCFTKNVRGYNSHLKINDFDFKSENEWRYVPRKSDIDGNLISQNQSTYRNNIELHNSKLLNFPLKFQLRDIEMVFVATSDEASQISKIFSIDSEKIQVSKWRT
jgi:hypothetical protein